MADNENGTLTDKMKSVLREVFLREEIDESFDTELPEEISAACERLVMEGAETARIVAITNIAGASVDSSIRVDLLQAQAGGVDFRSIYKTTTGPVLVELSNKHQVTWKPSADPYVSNPYRETKIDEAWVERRKGKLKGASELNTIIQYVTENSDDAIKVLRLLSHLEIQKITSEIIEYQVPPRLTVNVLATLLHQWLDEGVGGKRLEAVSISFLRYIGVNVAELWDEVISHRVNDPAPYDGLCIKGGQIQTVIEVKDQAVTLDFLKILSEQMREMGASRGLLFTRKAWLPAADQAVEINRYLQKRNELGLRIQIVDIEDMINSWLVILDQDDQSLPEFLKSLIDELEENGEREDRAALADLLRRL